MNVGYTRVSTDDQNLDLQVDALKKEGCDKVFQDVGSGAKRDREGLLEAMSYLRKGDTLVVWKLDRLGRSLQHLIELCMDFEERGIHLKSLRENIDTSSPIGKLFFHIIGALAEFEREIIRERTRAGLASARARGNLGGRTSIMDDQKIKMVQSLMKDRTNKVKDICKILGISKATLYRYAEPRGGTEKIQAD